MIKVGITQGDINGIGTEVIIKTFLDPAMLEICTPVIFGSQKVMSFHKKNLNLPDFNFFTVKDAEQAAAKKMNLVNVWEEEVPIEFGKSTPDAGRYAFRSLEAACDALQNGKVDALVTAPINKHNIQSENFKFAGHTEYLEMRWNTKGIMLLVSDKLRVGLVTGHVPLFNVAPHITPEKVTVKIKALYKALKEDFGINRPKIAVLGLNPHAGDNGTIGTEENSVIIPAIGKMKEEGMTLFGPYAADGFFGSSAYTKFDGVLAMYHDQGLAPFKALAFNSGVNFTAGLPVIRTSPDHGVGYDIAGKSVADESSFRNAIYTACDVFKTRNNWKEISSNPLPSGASHKKERH